MGILYKPFNCKRTVFCMLFMLFSVALSTNARAYDNIFIVENVHVDVTAENSVAARDQAFAKAQVDAFNELARRMVANGQVENIKTPDPMEISTLIQDYETTNEKLSSVRYVGTYTFRFKEQAVSRYFSLSGVTYTNTSSPTLLVLPFYQYGHQNLLWSDSNIWLQAWSRANLPRSLVPIEVPIGDVMDVADMGETSGLNYNASGLSRILTRYGAKEATLMLATPDAELASVGNTSAPAKGDLIVSIYRTDRAGPELVQDFVIAAQNGETVDALYNRAVVQAHSILQADWKTKTAASASVTNKVWARVLVKDLQEWVRVKNMLSRISGIEKVSVLSLKPGRVRIEFEFRGTEDRLRQVLAQGGLKLSAPYGMNNAQQFINTGGTSAGAPSTVYDLSLDTVRSNSFYIPQEEPAAGDGNEREGFGVHTF